MTDRSDMEAVIESILFVAHDPVSRTRLIEAFGEKEQEQAAEALDTVIERFVEHPERGVMIDEVAGGLRLVTRPDLHSYLKRFFEVSSKNKLTMPALETLAIIAYRQPITAPEVAELRNVGSTGVVKKLLERRLIRVAGRKEVVGKPFLYATTREFLMHFGLRSLKELPPLDQFEELFGDEMEAPTEDLEPDAEEIVDREAAELSEAEDDAADRQERDEIDLEREAAEVSEETKTETEESDKSAEEETPAKAEEEEAQPEEEEAQPEEEEAQPEEEEEAQPEEEEAPTEEEEEEEAPTEEEAAPTEEEKKSPPEEAPVTEEENTP